MKKRWICLLLAMVWCMGAFPALAAQKINIWIVKGAILAHDPSAAEIRIRPENSVRVTRHSLWPWDEEGTKWSMFVEIENTSDEKVVIDEDWLIACRANRDEIATAAYVFFYTTNVLAPGERAVLHAGAYPYVQGKHSNAEFGLDTWDVEGMEDFAGRIRQAKVLRVRLDTRGAASSANWPAVKIEPKIWIDGRTIHFEWTNDTDEPLEFRTIGAVVSDAGGRIVDVLCPENRRGAAAAPGETIAFEKELAPYITQEMAGCVSFEAFAYKFPQGE